MSWDDTDAVEIADRIKALESERDQLREEVKRLKAEVETASDRHGKTVLKYAEGSHQYEDMRKDRDAWKQKYENLEEDHKWLKRNLDENRMLVSDYTKLKQKSEALAEALADISVLNNDAYYPKGTIEDAFKIAEEALAGYRGEK